MIRLALFLGIFCEAFATACPADRLLAIGRADGERPPLRARILAASLEGVSTIPRTNIAIFFTQTAELIEEMKFRSAQEILGEVWTSWEPSETEVSDLATMMVNAHKAFGLTRFITLGQTEINLARGVLKMMLGLPAGSFPYLAHFATGHQRNDLISGPSYAWSEVTKMDQSVFGSPAFSELAEGIVKVSTVIRSDRRFLAKALELQRSFKLTTEHKPGTLLAELREIAKESVRTERQRELVQNVWGMRGGIIVPDWAAGDVP